MKGWLLLRLFLGCLLGVCLEVKASSALLTPPLSSLSPEQALQQGAKTFAQYCVSCHSIQNMKYGRLRGLGLSDAHILEQFGIQSNQLGEPIRAQLPAEQAQAVFGVVPPDLSLVTKTKAQGKGVAYVYTYLRSFYVDPSHPSGWNNLLLPNTAMPHAMADLQGEQHARWIEHRSNHDKNQVMREFTGFEQAKVGKMTAVQYDQTLSELALFLDFVAEPTKRDRLRWGWGVLSFFCVFAVLAWRLHAVYWKNIP